MQFFQSTLLFALPLLLTGVAAAPSQGKLIPIYRHEPVGCIDENVDWTLDDSACATFKVTEVPGKEGTRTKYQLTLNGQVCGSDPNNVNGFGCTTGDENDVFKFFFDGDLLGNPLYKKRPQKKFFFYGGPPPTDDPIPTYISSVFGERFNLQWQEVSE